MKTTFLEAAFLAVLFALPIIGAISVIVEVLK